MSPASPSKRLYLRNLPKYVNHGSLLKYLSSYGKITEVKIIHDYAFVQFESQKDAQDVVDTFRNQLFLGENITVEFARPMRKDMRPSGDSRTARNLSIPLRHVPDNVQCRYPVVVSNIPRKIRWQELKDFGRLPGGLVAFCDLDRRHQGRGFVEYFSKEDAERAIIELDNTFLGGQRVRVSGRPENYSRTRSRSPLRRATGPLSTHYTIDYRLPPALNHPKHEVYTHPRHHDRVADHDNRYRHHYQRRLPPSAYRPVPDLSYFSEDHLEPVSFSCNILAERSLVTLASESYPNANALQKSRYVDQYDYASHYSPVDASWKYDYNYAEGHVAEPFEVSLEQSPGDQAYNDPVS